MVFVVCPFLTLILYTAPFILCYTYPFILYALYMKSPIILYVEDDETIARLFERQFKMEDMPVHVARTGAEARALLATGSPDIILLDISLPDIDGFELLKELKSVPATKDIPVVILSNFTREEDIEWGKKLGAARFVDKVSLQPSEIVDIVKEVLADK